MAALSHALMFIASLFAAPVGAATDVAVCQSTASDSHIEREWTPTTHQFSVRAFGAFRKGETTALRVVGRCLVKAGAEHQRPVLFGSFTSTLDIPDDKNLSSARESDQLPFPQLSAVSAAPTDLCLLRDPVTQLERPPRV